jgi:hypothetical protein
MFAHQLEAARAIDQDHPLRQVWHKSTAGALLEMVTNTPLVAPNPTRLQTKPHTSAIQPNMQDIALGLDRSGPGRL